MSTQLCCLIALLYAQNCNNTRRQSGDYSFWLLKCSGETWYRRSYIDKWENCLWSGSRLGQGTGELEGSWDHGFDFHCQDRKGSYYIQKKMQRTHKIRQQRNTEIKPQCFSAPAVANKPDSCTVLSTSPFRWKDPENLYIVTSQGKTSLPPNQQSPEIPFAFQKRELETEVP